MRKVRAQLGPTSFGVQTIDLAEDSTAHLWHGHGEDGQEEMYIALEGRGVLELESGEHFPLERDSLIRVGPDERRRVLAGPSLRALAPGPYSGRLTPWQVDVGRLARGARSRISWSLGRSQRFRFCAQEIECSLQRRIALSVSQHSTDSLTFVVAEEFPGAVVLDHCA